MKKRKDGRYVKTVVDERTGKRVYFYGFSEREVLKKIMEYETQAERGRTFAEVADEWWEEKLEVITAGTKRGYSAAYQRSVDRFGEMPIKDIRPKDIERYLRTLVKEQYTTKSIKNDKLVISLIFDKAVVECDIQYNPCASVPIPRGLPSKPRHAASKTDEERIKDSADLWLFPFIALYTGMRKGEIIGLQWGDIDFDRNVITVSRAAEHLGSRAHIKQTKTEAGVRTIVLLAPLREELLKHPRMRSTDYVLSEDGGVTPLTAKQYNRALRIFKEKTGIECTAHQLRHSFATLCFEAGLPDKVIQHMIGHAHISTTKDIYTDLRAEMIDAAGEILNAKIAPSKEGK